MGAEEAERTNAVALAAAMASPLTSWLAVVKATYIGADPSSVMESKLSLLDDEEALSLSGTSLSGSARVDSPLLPSCSPGLLMWDGTELLDMCPDLDLDDLFCFFFLTLVLTAIMSPSASAKDIIRHNKLSDPAHWPHPPCSRSGGAPGT